MMAMVGARLANICMSSWWSDEHPPQWSGQYNRRQNLSELLQIWIEVHRRSQPSCQPDQKKVLICYVCFEMCFIVLFYSFISRKHFERSRPLMITGWQKLAVFQREQKQPFAHNCKLANLSQDNMQHIPCNSALLAPKNSFLPNKHLFALSPEYVNCKKS